jgi:hypothetical protein
MRARPKPRNSDFRIGIIMLLISGSASGTLEGDAAAVSN